MNGHRAKLLRAEANEVFNDGIHKSPRNLYRRMKARWTRLHKL